ncbi:MAG: hypothetical protein WAU16_07210 [Rhizobiaceae bacterium]
MAFTTKHAGAAALAASLLFAPSLASADVGPQAPAPDFDLDGGHQAEGPVPGVELPWIGTGSGTVVSGYRLNQPS